MKPHQRNRSRSYYRHHRRRVIQRKLKIAEHGWHVRFPGQFAKGKVHCSCWMCTQKTNKDGFPHSQIRQLEGLNNQLSEYFREGEI